jgi:L-lactate dehydrogenase complex protein LldF
MAAMTARPGEAALCAGIDRALSDPRLQQLLAGTQDYMQDNLRAVRATPEWTDALDEIGRVRAAALARLDELAERFAANVEAAGGTVFFAADAREARDHVVALARERDVRSVVKTKSMVTEEIGLNAALLAHGVDVWETDLGAFITQMTGDRPFHILGPAMHLSLEDVRELFSRAAGCELPPDPQALTRFAREALRERFLSAEMGVTGANFGVASTGSVVLVTNEGNGRMVTTLPRTHVVVMGVERLVPTLADLEPILKVLPWVGACLPATAYVTAVTGPRRDGEQTGAEELHVVLVDNGRSRILAGRYAAVLRCIRCGACVDVCPAYRKIGGHAYDSVYSGPIGAVLNPLLFGLERYGEQAWACSLCGACSEACPARVPLADFLRSLREDVAARERSVWRTSLAAYGGAAARPALWAALERALLPLARAASRWDGRLRLPGPIGAWTAGRALPRADGRSFRACWREDDPR